MDLERDIERIIDALEKQQQEVLYNAAEQLRSIRDLIRAHKNFMGRSARAVMENPYNGPQQGYDRSGMPRRN
jgi:hypothetical protein